MTERESCSACSEPLSANMVSFEQQFGQQMGEPACASCTHDAMRLEHAEPFESAEDRDDWVDIKARLSRMMAS